ncbi:MAG: N-acetylmuramoyl-L-alanine amidase family protein [Desulfovibrionaceae bacterium]
MKKLCCYVLLFSSIVYWASSCTAVYAKSVHAKELGLELKTIVVDAGHGGKDPGAIGNGLMEKEFTLQFSRILEKLLREKGYRIYQTRTKDQYIPLEERTSFANKKKADLFLSIHINANNNKAISGFESYYLSTGSDKRALLVASRENAVSPNNLSALQMILSDFTLDSKQSESKNIADLIQKSVLKTVRNNKYTLRDSGVRSAPFFVLLGARMPAILLEMGYTSNVEESKKLKDPNYLYLLAQGIVNAIEQYKRSLQG